MTFADHCISSLKFIKSSMISYVVIYNSSKSKTKAVFLNKHFIKKITSKKYNYEEKVMNK